MNYDFDTLVERRGTRSDKWDSYPADVLPMWIADSDFRSPQPVIDAIMETARRGVFGYTRADGAFESAYAGWMRRSFGWDVAPERVLWCPSVGTALAIAIRAFTRPGDGVAMMLPIYPPFLRLCALNGREARATLLRCEDGRYRIDFADLERKLAEERTRLLLLCNPHNPTGRVFEEDELRRVGELCLKYNVVVFSDEIHGDIVFSGRHIPFPTLSPELAAVSLVGVNASKTFNLADLRSAAVLSENDALLEAFARERDSLKLGRCSLGVAGVIAAYEQCADYAEQLREYLRGNLQFAVDFLHAETPEITTRMPEGTFLLWLDCRRLGLSGNDLAAFFLEKARVALNDGETFGEGGRGFMRMNAACPRSLLEEGLRRIRRAVRG